MIKTFKQGGIHPDDNKSAAESLIEPVEPQGTAVFFLSQHIGATAEPVVAKGDKVKVGRLIAKAVGFVSANIHSSVSGTVVSVGPVSDHLGFRKPAVTIAVEGDEWSENIDRSPEVSKKITMSPEEIVRRVADAGIVGLGGAAFPTHVKLSIPRGKKAEYLIVNAAECEPYLTSDYRIIMEYPEQIIAGVKILMTALGVLRAYIGIEINKPEAIGLLTALTANYSEIEIVPLKTKYPQGGEKQLIKAVINREVPSGGLPVDVGAIVHNVGTAYSVYEAVQKNKPLIENIITVTGKSVKQRKNFLVRTGTPVSRLIELSGGLPENTGKIILGGPMMGKAISNINAPTQKSTSSILLTPDTESKRSEPSNCIRCARCVSACPMGLEPYLLIKQVERKMFDASETAGVHDCIECGSCAYSCPAGLPLLDYIRIGKTEVMKIRRTRKPRP